MRAKEILALIGNVCLILVFLVLPFMVICTTEIALAEPIIIGVPSGLGSQHVKDGWNSVIMAVEEINAKGGVAVGDIKRDLKAYSMDTREQEPGIPVHEALAAIEKLILEKKPHAIVLGAMRSEVLLASMDLISKYKVPYICSLAMTPMFEKKINENYDKYKYFFRTSLNSVDMVNYMTEALQYLNKEYGFDKIYIITQDAMYATAFGKMLKGWCEKNNFQVLGLDSYPTGATEFSSSLLRAKQGKAQLISTIFDMPEATIMLRQARAMKLPALFVGGYPPATTEKSWETYRGETEGLINFFMSIGNIPVKAVPKSVAYNENYGKRWGVNARKIMENHGGGTSYDAVYILTEAIKRAGTLEPDAVVSALEKTDMEGVIGRIKFTKDHQVIYGLNPKEAAISCLIQWKKPGVRVPVFPTSIAEGKIELPAFMK